MTAQLVYILCGATSIACAVLLARGYRRYGTPLLLWSTLSFAMLSVHNVLLYLDMVTFRTGPDLLIARSAVGACAGLLLLYGLIRETAGPRELRRVSRRVEP